MTQHDCRPVRSQYCFATYNHISTLFFSSMSLLPVPDTPANKKVYIRIDITSWLKSTIKCPTVIFYIIYSYSSELL